MTIRHLQIFIAVAETGSMSAAAKRLYISQPTVSQVIAEMEEEYGVLLFERLAKRLCITDAGSRLLGYARHAVALSMRWRTLWAAPPAAVSCASAQALRWAPAR